MLWRAVASISAVLGPLALAGSLMGAAAGQNTAGTPTADKTNQYVDSSECARCHRQIYESFRQTGMGKSFYRPAPSNTIEDYKDKNHYYSVLSDTHYTMIIRDGVYYQRRWQVGLNGAETNVEELKIDYVLGSGDQARSYLHKTDRDTLIELPLGWYSERGGYWAMSPGFDSKHPQTRRLASYECTFCHTGYPQLSDKARSQTIDPVFTGRIAEGIDCQRCHGPGGQHIRAGQSPTPTLAEFQRTIVNPAKLEPKRQMEVCMQCHLEPTSGHLPSIVRKFDRDPFSYIPGQPLEDFTRYFDYPEGKGYDDRFQIVSAAYRLRKSRCFRESKGAMTCLNCHDPHRVLPSGQQAVEVYATACRKCHNPALEEKVAAGKHTSSNDCVSCHMPKRRTEDVVHAFITDHVIQRKPPNDNLLLDLTEVHIPESEEYHGEVTPYYPAEPPPTSENNLYRGVAQVVLQNNLAKGVADLSREINLHPPPRAEFYTTLGDAWGNSGKPDKASAAYEQALRLDGKSLSTLQSLALALQKQGEATKSRQVLDQALQISPKEPNILYQYGLLNAKQGKFGEALSNLQQALLIDPDIPEGYFNLANLLLQMGKAQEAEAALVTALSIDPYDAAAYDLKGQVMARKSSVDVALYAFDKAVKLRPGYAPYLYDHALALVQAGRYDDAKIKVQAAIKAVPGYAEAHEVLGALYLREKQPALALREYQQAVMLQPELSHAQLNLGLLLYSQGDSVGAIEHLKKAAAGPDPGIASQAAQALQQLIAR